MRLTAGVGSFLLSCLTVSLLAQTEPARPLPQAATPLPAESQSADIGRFSFFVYGDTRSRMDGAELQPDHVRLVNGMLDAIERLKNTPFPVRFVLSTGDGVTNGRDGAQWNRSFVDVVSRLVRRGNVSYFMTAGNHDVTTAGSVDAPGRVIGLANFLAVNDAFIPADGGLRRLAGYPTYAFGYGNTFFLTLDSNLAGDDTQFAWVKRQLDGLDRSRYVNIVIFTHHPVFSSGPHGGAIVEPSTAALRSRYMPLFNAHHVNAVFAGHDHLFEHWAEHYKDATGPHRMDLIVTGGGGAPPYPYVSEPETRFFNIANHASMEHVVKPGRNAGDTPYHFVIVRVDGNRLSMEVVGVESGKTFRPYDSSPSVIFGNP
jgi:hypothetical protein